MDSHKWRTSSSSHFESPHCTVPVPVSCLSPPLGWQMFDAIELGDPIRKELVIAGSVFLKVVQDLRALKKLAAQMCGHKRKWGCSFYFNQTHLLYLFYSPGGFHHHPWPCPLLWSGSSLSTRPRKPESGLWGSRDSRLRDSMDHISPSRCLSRTSAAQCQAHLGRKNLLKLTTLARISFVYVCLLISLPKETKKTLLICSWPSSTSKCVSTKSKWIVLLPRHCSFDTFLTLPRWAEPTRWWGNARS